MFGRDFNTWLLHLLGGGVGALFVYMMIWLVIIMGQLLASWWPF